MRCARKCERDHRHKSCSQDGPRRLALRDATPRPSLLPTQIATIGPQAGWKEGSAIVLLPAVNNNSVEQASALSLLLECDSKSRAPETSLNVTSVVVATDAGRERWGVRTTEAKAPLFAAAFGGDWTPARDAPTPTAALSEQHLSVIDEAARQVETRNEYASW